MDDDFTRRVESVRMGTIFGHDQKAYERWRRSSRPVPKGGGLTGHALEQAVMRIAEMFPDNVIVG